MLTNPLFLICLVAVGIPIAIHLLQLRRYRKVYFSNVDMLEEVHSESRKQNNLRRLLLLAARILTVVFLVLAFCQPVLRNKASTMQAGGSAVSVYVDNSYSMECGGMDGSLLESARQKAREIAEGYRPDDLFQLITNESSGSQFRWLTREEFLSAVDAIEPSAVTQKLSDMALRQYDFLKEAQSANRRAYVISDFQRSTADVASFPSDSSIYATFIPLGGSEVANLYIDSLAFNAPAYAPGATVRVQAFVRNDGDKTVERLPLKLFVDDRQRALTAVDVPAHGSASAEMTFTIAEEGSMQGYVETTDYPITFDDKMYFSLNVSRRIPMLVISGNGENEYLHKLLADDSLVAYHQMSQEQIDYSQLTNHRIIVLDELRTVPSGLAQTLHDFVSEGGTIVMIPAQNADVESYNRMLSTMQAPAMDSWQPRKAKAARLQRTHPLYRDVFQSDNEDMELPSVNGYYRLSTASSSVSVSVITLPGGADFLSETPFGNGRLFLFATPLRTEYTDFVQQALFVPTLFNMALFSVPAAVPYHLLTATEPLPLVGRYDADRPPHLRSSESDFDLIPDIRRVGSAQFCILHGDITSAGNYQLVGEASESLSFNYSREESCLDAYSRDEIKKLMRQSHADFCSVVPASAKSMTEYVQSQNQGTPLWRLFVVLALLALIAEIILARGIKS